MLHDPAPHIGQVYELTGPKSQDLHGFAAEYAAALESFGVPAPIAQLIAGWDAAAAKGALFDDSRQLSQLIGRPTTPLADSVARALTSEG